MVKLQLEFLPYTTGYVHVQTNPKLFFSTERTVKNGPRIASIFKELVADKYANRLCVKVPATWEGLQACRALEAQGIPTLATTMFCMEQASLAADANCTYIAPYVNELRVHFDKGFVDEHKAFDFCAETQRYYENIQANTQLLAASLTSVEEVMQLAGVHHITVSPPLLRELASTPADLWQSYCLNVF
ncbi:transaldolase [Cordyceps fumosorosea ARSEF 2679]|uniref:Transaldolase n=1 Tax=Cordyceps fumosorosea (strain ARSEF 2679) TaxID=1081104 RepID=A0A168EDE7_CORFA|nr:transaldolase [Cordyceps fumosorosea ARSEF 2679]OAA73680.1 transaldolase [Cordyceps fumosorosea ARSEF 2679]